MPTETTLNSLKVHKVPDFETWEENYNQTNGIGTSDVVVIPPEELKKGVLPDQTNNSGKFLSTNGASTSWETVDALPPQAENSGKFLTTDGTVASWADAPEEVFIVTYDTTTYADALAAYNAGKTLIFKESAYVNKLSSEYSYTSNTNFVFHYFNSQLQKCAATLKSSGWSRVTNDLVPAIRTVNNKLLSADITLTASDVGAVATSTVGAASGVAPLNASGKIDSTYLPSYVDDVIEGYYYNSKFYTTSAHTTEITGETGKIFVDLSTNKTYRYGGSSFTEISQGSIVSVSRDLTSGTKIGTLTINGTGTDLYAPTPETFTVTGGASTIVSDNLTANRALISNTNGKVAVSDVTSIELGYLDGVTSAIQTQIDDKQAKVTASGILKGDGSGGVSAATAGTDYQAPLPSQTNNSGKFLTTNGSALSWGTVDALPSQTNNSGKFLTTNGTSASWATVSIPTVPTMDSTPTNGNSSNTVSSDGVYDMVMGRTKIYTATCSTGASTAAKVATLDDSTGFSLAAGVKVAVTFTYGNSATTPTLNVNSSGAKTIAIPSSATAYTTGNGSTYNTWGAYETVLFTYTGTYWAHDTSGYLGYLAYNTASGKQTKITASGILKGDGAGGVTAATAGTDYQAPLPSQSGNSGKYLTTNGSAMSWGTVDALPSQTGNSGKYLTTNGTTASWGDTLSTNLLEIDSTPANGSSHLVTSGGVYTAINNIDALPSQSGNSGKYLTTNGSAASWGDSVSGSLIDIESVSEISIDTTPTQNSTNPITSNGVYNMVMNRTKIYTGTCTTAAGTTAKVVTLDDATGFSLTTGVMVLVLFTDYHNTGSPTLNVNNTGAKLIKTPVGISGYDIGLSTNSWAKNERILFTYTGDGWVHSPSAMANYLNFNNNRATYISDSDTQYEELMARGEKLLNASTFDSATWSSQLVNGAIAWRYE